MLTAAVNISEGRRSDVVVAIGARAGRALLDIHSDSHHHRSVLTVGGPDAERAVRDLVTEAVARLDLGTHVGAHPRIGVVDVVPFTPWAPADLAVAEAARDRFARWAADEASVPVFIYGEERSLPDIRRGVAQGTLRPDHGGPEPHPTAGFICAGARPPMLAWNLWLSDDARHATRAIAAELRRLPGVRALPFDLGGRPQVACNLIEPLKTPPHLVYDAVEARATVRRCELVGLMPDAVLQVVPRGRWAQLDLSVEQTVEWRLGG